MYAVPYECNKGTLKLRLVEPNNKADVSTAPPCVEESENPFEENIYHELDDIRV